MNYLWVRLSIAFSAVAFISFIAVSMITVVIVRANLSQNNQDDPLRTFSGLRDQLSLYYEAHNSWDGVDTLFAGAKSVFPPGFSNQADFALVSPDGTLIYGTSPEDGDTVDTLPVTLGDQTIADLVVGSQPRAAPSGFRFLSNLGGFGADELLLLLTVVGGIIGILFGILISRSLTTPLDNLAAAAESVGAGQSSTVQVRGTVEITSLANSFNRMVEQLQDAETLRRNLVADVAHELRTPITALQANLYAMLDDAYPMTKTEIAGLYEQTRVLSRLVNDLHELSLADAKQLPLTLKRINLGSALKEFVAPFQLVVEDKGVEFELEAPENLPTVCIDEERFNQVLHNLLGNALRHTPAEGKITVRLSRIDKWVQVEVSDTGEGIPAEHLPHVFERLYRADYGRSRDSGGTGLGLAVAKALVEAHGGLIDVASAGVPGEGTTFSVRLPLDTDCAPAGETVERRALAEEDAAQT